MAAWSASHGEKMAYASWDLFLTFLSRVQITLDAEGLDYVTRECEATIRESPVAEDAHVKAFLLACAAFVAAEKTQR